jgi:DNA-binding MurR/RpiR family transcriptional regulator
MDREEIVMLKDIIRVKENLPKQQRNLCNYILENYQSIGLVTISELANKAGVGTTTVMRVMEKLGYRSYSDMKKDLHELTINSMHENTWWHMEKSFKPETNNKNEKTIVESWQEILNILDNSLKESLLKEFHKCIHLLLKANTIHILGLRSSLAQAVYFEYLLEGFYPKTNQLSLNSDLVFDRIFQFKDGDILFVITNSPYTDRSLEAAEFCNRQGYPIILLTDHLSCPISSYADVILQTTASDKQYSIVPSIAILESIVIEIGRKTAGTSIKNLNSLGEILKQYHITRSI